MFQNVSHESITVAQADGMQIAVPPHDKRPAELRPRHF
jgi:hypothetical protein